MLLGFEQPRVFDCDHGLVGKGLQKVDLPVREQAHLGARDRNAPDGNVVAQYRDGHGTAITGDRRHLGEAVFGIRAHIRNLHNPSLEDCARRHAAPVWRRGICAAVELQHLRGKAAVRDEVQKLAIKAIDKAELGLAQSRCAFGDHVEHRLGVRHRAGNDTQHLGRRGLLLERLPLRSSVRCLQLVEQANVLDCDHRLVGKGG